MNINEEQAVIQAAYCIVDRKVLLLHRTKK